jgi:hypothetical protein
MEDLDDAELDSMLSAWKVVGAPRPLRTPWWRRSVRVPLPLAAAILLAIVYGVIRLAQPAPVTIRWQPVNEIKLRVIRSSNARN